jgi:hypothetical protein
VPWLLAPNDAKESPVSGGFPQMVARQDSITSQFSAGIFSIPDRGPAVPASSPQTLKKTSRRPVPCIESFLPSGNQARLPEPHLLPSSNQ